MKKRISGLLIIFLTILALFPINKADSFGVKVNDEIVYNGNMGNRYIDVHFLIKSVEPTKVVADIDMIGLESRKDYLISGTSLTDSIVFPMEYDFESNGYTLTNYTAGGVTNRSVWMKTLENGTRIVDRWLGILVKGVFQGVLIELVQYPLRFNFYQTEIPGFNSVLIITPIALISIIYVFLRNKKGFKKIEFDSSIF